MLRSKKYLRSLLKELILLPKETSWVEFKHNNADPQAIGEYIAALSNTATLEGKANAYMVWGVKDETHEVVGTNFRPYETKKGNEELENWILRLLSPKINFIFYELEVSNGIVVILEVGRAINHPVSFSGQEYIRIGSYKKKLKNYPDKERRLWRVLDQILFEDMFAADNVPEDEVLGNLDYPSYFDLLNIPLPENRKLILERLTEDRMIMRNDGGGWSITN